MITNLARKAENIKTHRSEHLWLWFCEYSEEHPKVPEVEQIMPTEAQLKTFYWHYMLWVMEEFGEQVALHLTKKLVSSWILERVKM